MTMRIRIAMMLTAAVAMLAVVSMAVPQLHAQNKPSPSARIPFYSHANGEPLHGQEDTQIGVFENDIPQGKRLVVQYVSVSVNGNASEEMIAASCHLTGSGLGVDLNGNPQIVRHLLPLTSRRSASGSEIFTAGLQVTIYLEPGPHGLLCSAGVANARLTALEAFVSGELVSP